MTVRASLSKFFGTFRMNVDLEAPGRGITGLLGPSGCGKTSLLRAMAGLDRAEGEMRVGLEVWQDRDVFTPPHLRPVGYVFQEPTLFPHLTVEENLRFGMSRVPAAQRKLDLADAVEMFGLQEMGGRKPDGMSGGERQRVCIARALLTSPKLLLLDEPLSSLDVTSKENLFPFLDRIHRDLDIPVIYVSHDPDEIARLADHIILMNRGQVVASGSIQEVFTNLDLPISLSTNAVSVIEGTVIYHDAKYLLSLVEFSGGRLEVPSVEANEGDTVRVRIHARDVSLAREPSVSSILNSFPATVKEMSSASDMSQVTVKLTAGEDVILARITNKSVDALGIRPELDVHVQVKSVSLLK